MTDRKIVKSEHGSVDHPAPQHHSSNVTQMDMAATAVTQSAMHVTGKVAQGGHH